MTREELFSRMVHQRTSNFTHPILKRVVPGLIQAIQMEDGSGSSFNVTFFVVGEDELLTIHIVTDKPTTIGPGNL